ncbi:hypothetical protein [Desulfuromonas sp. AOP6]|uniref:hypothetical protein n=1 Tax=Desulfuromonas sp. AOP6 TaxID=1566351 RepID=UPI00128A7CD0|nr:hypothetical protein [Desulfuromonas sp. AOP6]BCA79153.1 hypothetical protein AOP6_0940 [Desulfuromonas sp. AOP6]
MNIIPPTSPVPFAVQPVVSTSSLHEQRQYDLHPNQMVRATVAEGGADRALLDLGHQQVLAETKVPLQKGQKLNLMVVETSPQLILQIVEDKLASRLLRSLHLLAEKPEMLPLLGRLLAGSFSGKGLPEQAQAVLARVVELMRLPPGQLKGEGLAELIRLLGLDAEALLAKGDGAKALAGLKGALLQVAGLLAEDSATAAMMEKQLKGLELYQLCRVRLEQDGMLFFPLLLPFLEQGFVFAQKNESESDGEAEISHLLSLHLRLEGLGNLQIRLLHDGKGVFLRFYCESQAIADFVGSFSDELNEGLASLPLQGVSFTDGAQEPARVLAETAMPERDGLLDARV